MSSGPGRSQTSMVARRGRVSGMMLAACGSLVAAILLGYVLVRMQRPPSVTANSEQGPTSSRGAARELYLFCAAGMRYPMDEIVAKYEREFGVSVNLQYGGSNTLLNQIEVSKTGDLYLAADNSYIVMGREKGLIEESIPIAKMRPVIAVKAGNPLGVHSIDDLINQQLRLAIGDPTAAAVGKKTRRLLQETQKWAAIETLTKRKGVFKPTVNDAANAVKIGSVDAAILWDSTVAQYPELEAVAVPELDAGESLVQIAVLTSCKNPPAALHFCRYVSAFDRGLESFRAKGFRTVDGDAWSDHPQLVFFAGSVNRRALEPIIREFEQREGVRVTTVYNGCGILTAQMQTLKQQGGKGFPDAYMACDVYYLDTVRDLFQESVIVSETDIVIVVQKGNPKGIQGIRDLVRPGIRVALGQPDQCTIGVLSRRLLEQAGLYDQCVRNNVVTQTATSALLVPTITTGSADAALAYRTDTLAVGNEVDVVPIDSELAKAIQPFAISKTSPHKQLARRLFARIAKSKDVFEQLGFAWRLSRARSSAEPVGADR